MRKNIAFFALCVYASVFAVLNASELKSDEYVMFIPNIAYDLDDKTIAVQMEAYVYEKERRLGFTSALASMLDIDIEKLNDADKKRLYERTALFRIDYEGDKEFSIEFEDGSVYEAPTTDDGKSVATFEIKKPAKKYINFEVHNPQHKSNESKGFALYAKNSGVSAVFDIDDTIKDSNVLDKKALLVNTFLREYKTVKGIEKVFEHTRNLRADAYHYVSASPAQLYPTLSDFFERSGIPKGTFHLREATDLSDFLADKETTINHKKDNIEKLFKAYPKRKFILVGDSGENDPEIYANLQRKYPDKVLLIIIRDLDKSGGSSARLKKSFEGVNKNKLMFF
ncbi:MAG: App1 family protein [Helicobacteraceae bacterium]|jgi:hypothetical protein|nr:App1 family protein [Helicobacteraceae bacterium]